MKKYGKVGKRTIACSLSAAMIFSLAACGSSSNSDTAANTDTSDAAAVTESEAVSDGNDLEGAVGKKVDEYSGYLGYGYDVLNAAYFNESDVDATAEVLDMDSLAASGYVRVANMNKTTVDSFEGASYSEVYGYLTGASALGIDYGFGGSLDYIFSGSEIDASDLYAYKLYIAEVNTSRDVISAKTSALKDYLSEGFAEDLEKLSGEEILDKYGSYVMTDITNGGKFMLFWDWANSSSYDAEELYAATDEYLGDYWDFDSPYGEEFEEVDLETILADYADEEQTSIIAEGGSVAIDGTDPFAALDSYADWAASVTSGDTAFINCTSGIWIWDIVALVDSDLADEVHEAYDAQYSSFIDEYVEE